MKQYKLIAGPTTKQMLDKGSKDSDAIQAFENIIAQQAQQGWEYHSMEPITTTHMEGCLFSKTPVSSTFYMLVFVKE